MLYNDKKINIGSANSKTFIDHKDKKIRQMDKASFTNKKYKWRLCHDAKIVAIILECQNAMVRIKEPTANIFFQHDVLKSHTYIYS